MPNPGNHKVGKRLGALAMAGLCLREAHVRPECLGSAGRRRHRQGNWLQDQRKCTGRNLQWSTLEEIKIVGGSTNLSRGNKRTVWLYLNFSYGTDHSGWHLRLPSRHGQGNQGVFCRDDPDPIYCTPQFHQWCYLEGKMAASMEKSEIRHILISVQLALWALYSGGPIANLSPNFMLCVSHWP